MEFGCQQIPEKIRTETIIVILRNKVIMWLNSGKELTRKGAIRVSSKQTKINFGSNRNKPKQDLLRVCFSMFHETIKKKFWFVSVFRTYIETTETNKFVFRNKPKQPKIF